MKKILACLSMLFFSSVLMAQGTETPKSFWNDPLNDPMAPVYLVAVFILIVMVLVVVVALYLARVLSFFVTQMEIERSIREKIPYIPRPSWWERLNQKLNASVPVAQEGDIDLGHNFDGIRELDNHLPPWWKWLFYGTIGWAAVYLIVYHISTSLPLSAEEYDTEIAVANEQVQRLKASQPALVVDENTLVYSADAAQIEKGKAVFSGNSCGTCHRADGGGNTIGPNLTDDFWIHGGGIRNVFVTIRDGAVEKGMPAWGKTMSAQDVRDVAFFVMSLQGTNPTNPKAPQGEKYIPAETVVADSTKVQASL